LEKNFFCIDLSKYRLVEALYKSTCFTLLPAYLSMVRHNLFLLKVSLNTN